MEGVSRCVAREYVADALRQVVGDDSVSVTDEDLLEDLGVDSLSSFELRLLLSERLLVDISVGDFAKLDTVGSLVEQVVRSSG